MKLCLWLMVLTCILYLRVGVFFFLKKGITIEFRDEDLNPKLFVFKYVHTCVSWVELIWRKLKLQSLVPTDWNILISHSNINIYCWFFSCMHVYCISYQWKIKFLTLTLSCFNFFFLFSFTIYVGKRLSMIEGWYFLDSQSCIWLFFDEF